MSGFFATCVRYLHMMLKMVASWFRRHETDGDEAQEPMRVCVTDEFTSSWKPDRVHEEGLDGVVQRKFKNEFKYDVFISHEENDTHSALEFKEMLESHGLTCILKRDFKPNNYVIKAFEDAVTSSRRIVMLLSREYLHTGWCMFELQMSITEMFDTQRALIVPVLLDVTEAEVPTCLRNLSLVDKRGDPNYRQKLLSILKRPEIGIREMMPVGNVAHGLAWSYYCYLQINLPKIAERVEMFCSPKNKDCKDLRMPRKLYILVPASCYCPSTLDTADIANRITFGGHLESLHMTSAGSKGRVYNHTVWNIRRDNGEILQFVGEYCNSVHTLYKMESEFSAGLDSQQRRVQRNEFLVALHKILARFNHLAQARVVFFRDTDDEGNMKPLSDILQPLVERDRLPMATP